jgi:hypothetical protein
LQNGETYLQSYGEIAVMITCEVYCRRTAVNLDISANGYGKFTLDAEEGTQLICPSGVIG